MGRSALCGVALTLTLAACDGFDYLGWPDEPIHVSLQGGIPIAPLTLDQDPSNRPVFTIAPLVPETGPRQAMIDISTPVTVLNQAARSDQLRADGRFAGYQLLTSLGERSGDLRLHDGLDARISRFIFRDVRVFDLPLEDVGLETPQPINGILGGDILTHFVVRLGYGSAPSVSLGSRLADTDEELSGDCDEKGLLDASAPRPDCSAVMRATRFGGGTMLIGDKEIDLGATRLVLGACIAPDLFDPTTSTMDQIVDGSGVPVSALISTGFGVSVIARSAFERLRARRPELVEGPQTVLFLPNGQHAVTLTEIPVVALVDDLTVDLGPCEELSRRRRLLLAYREGADPRDRTHLGAAVAEVDSPVTFAILADEAALLQGLRNELRPLVADVDVVLGGSFLSHFVPTFDFPGGRVIMRCAPGDGGCFTIPRCYTDDRQPACPQEASL